MSVITFTSDFGDTDHYVAAVKATVFSIFPEAQIVDISHKIRSFDIAHAAFTLGSVFRNFPEKTVHLVITDMYGNEHNPSCIALLSEGHCFVGMDNGLFSLIGEKKPERIVRLPQEDNLSFSHTLAQAAAKLAKGISIEEAGTPQSDLYTMLQRMPKVTRNNIRGQVIHVDFYGNLVTNIRRADFERTRHDRAFLIRFAREHTDVIDGAYNARSAGDCILLFNDTGFLEIAINKGNAASLLGMAEDSPVTIQFTPEIN